MVDLVWKSVSSSMAWLGKSKRRETDSFYVRRSNRVGSRWGVGWDLDSWWGTWRSFSVEATRAQVLLADNPPKEADSLTNKIA